ncbi:polyprenyl synthetase family protein [Lentzea flava]|uniref:Dimethylallyltransferase n=1 Tax=Lentzea flava TaxID=103732 RepID=A0ABQ2VGV0_9PSEU|nr:polyprenyl synthetase family protein [Lentzea flava]MCP2205373.1 geranylgeranyl diphosphate synthase, type I [Lentzea flava]GGU86328.1 dimethylallyltransferase [Lentzea flava]
MLELIDAQPVPAAEILRRCGAEVSVPIREAVDLLPAELRVGAGFHFGWWDADGTPLSASQGKRVRPAFVLSAARAVSGQTNDQTLRAAVAVELVHNFTLVHDDVMDADKLRRGRPTVWAQFGIPYAILLGDAMLALANQIVTRAGDDTRLCRLLNEVTVALCMGQQQDMAFEQSSTVSIDDYVEMVTGKTAALLAGACVLGGLAGGAGPNDVEVLRRFGHHVGLAFQLVDDVLGIWGDPTVTGKPVGADLCRYKKSMPVLAAMGSGSPAGRLLRDMYRSRSITDADAAGRATHLIQEAGGREWTESQATRHHQFALECLDDLGPQWMVSELRALADFMVRRDK